MQTCRINLAFANSAVIAILLGPTRPALPQDAQSWADAYVNRVDAEVAEYLQKHPVRRSLLFDSVSSMLETLGQTKARTMHECEYEPELPDGEAVVARLRENTKVALHQSFSKGKARYGMAPPWGEPVVAGYFCDELMRQYDRILSDLQGVGPALRKQGY